MDFTKLKLVTEMYVDGGQQGSMAGAKLTQQANVKASQQAQAPKAATNTSNSIGLQQKQMSQKMGNVQSPNVQKPGGAPAKSATTSGPTTVVSHYDYFHALQRKKEFVKNLQEKKVDWKTELKEALGADDEVFHPYVEVMPFKDFKQNEAKKNLAGQAMKQGAAENPAQVKAKSKMMGMATEGYKKQSERKHDDMNDAALKKDIEYRRKLNPDADEASLMSGKFSGEGNTITGEITDYRNDPTEYKKQRKAKEIENKARGYRKRNQKNEEYVQERVFVQPEGTERKKREKQDKDKKARAAQDAVRHMRATRGIPGYDAKGKYYLKNGKKEYENAD